MLLPHTVDPYGIYKHRRGAFFPNLGGRLPKTPHYKFLPSRKFHMFVVNPFNIELNLNYSQYVPRSKHCAHYKKNQSVNSAQGNKR